MDSDISVILESELYSAQNYFDRLFTVIDQLEKMSLYPEIKKISANLYYELSELLQSEIIPPNLRSTQNQQTLLILNGPKIFFKSFDLAQLLTQQLSLLIKMPTAIEPLAKLCCSYIDTLLQFCYEFHLYLTNNSTLAIDLPRSFLLTSNGESPIAKFVIDQDKLQELLTTDLSNLNSLEQERDKKYNHHLQKGHHALFNKDATQALNHLQRAAVYKQTAEVLTLIGWSFAQLGKNEQAKQACFEAVQLDKKYGPALNDLGTYFMAEQKFDQALKWFELAKRAPHYANREFPFINASKIYINQKNYQKALKELKQAHALIPHEEELLKMIKNVEQILQHDKPKHSTFEPTIVT